MSNRLMKKRRPTKWLDDVADRLERLRKALGFKSQKSFADAIGVEYQTYNKWAKGDRMPDPMVMSDLHYKFGVSLDWLYAGDMSGLPYHLAQKLLGETSSSLNQDGDNHVKAS